MDPHFYEDMTRYLYGDTSTDGFEFVDETDELALPGDDEVEALFIDGDGSEPVEGILDQRWYETQPEYARPGDWWRFR